MFHLMAFFMMMMGLYFLPSIIGWHKHNATAIVAVNVLLGWTVVGWFVALVWALSEAPVVGTNMPANWGPFSSWQPAGPGPQAPPQPSYQPPPPQPPPQAPPAAPQTRAGFCSHCGSALRMGDRYCAGCGSSVPQA